jgi:hypothetical protein
MFDLIVFSVFVVITIVPHVRSVNLRPDIEQGIDGFPVRMSVAVPVLAM